MSQSALVDLSPVSVLCIDDDSVIRSVVRSALQRHGCRDVVQAHSGLEALDLCAGRTFNLLICDHQMAPMTGLEFLRELADTGLGEGWPVIMLSADTDPATFQEARSFGVQAWVGKPVSVQTLMEQVGTVLRLSGHIGTRAPDPEMLAMTERHHARLMAHLRAAESSTQNLSMRPREATNIVHGLRQIFDDVAEHARTLSYGLITMLAGRATDLVAAMERNPGAALRGNSSIIHALGTMITAMKRVAQNRMAGDGGEGGLKLLSAIDGIIGPVRAGLG
jgi:two-component system chemotaxis response regulator CheY